MKLDPRPLPAIARMNRRRFVQRFGIARQAAREVAEHRSELALAVVVKGLGVALEVVLAERAPNTPFESLGVLLDRKRQYRPDEVVLVVDDTKISRQVRTLVQLVLGYFVVERRRIERDGRKALVNLFA